MSPADVLSFSLLSALGGAAVRAIPIAVAAVLAIRLLRIRTAAAQHAVWLIVSAAMLVLPLVTAVLPPVRLPVGLSAPVPPVTVAAPASAPVQRAAPIVLNVNETGLASISEVVSRPITWWAVCLAAVYVAGFLIVCTRVAAGLRGVSRLLARARLLRDSAANAALTELADECRMPYPRPAVYESDDVAVPVFIAGQGDSVVLPADWRQRNDWKLRAVLAHELAHARRRDGLSVALGIANRALFWFHPLAWWLERRTSELCEQASDDSAVSSTGDAARYAEVLLEVAAAARHSSGRLTSKALPAMSMAGVSDAARRIHKILDADTVTSGVLTTGQWRIAVAVAVPVIGLLGAAQTSGHGQAKGDISPSWQPVQEGFAIKPEIAGELEATVARSPDDLASRAKLLAFYFYNAKHDDIARHARWVVEHYPGSELAASDIVRGANRVFSDSEPARLERVKAEFRALWLRQAALHDGDARVVGNAGRALMEDDPAEAERLLLRALELDSTNRRWKRALAELYALAIQWDIHSGTGAYWFLPRTAVPPAFAARARSQLMIPSADSEVVGYTGERLALSVLRTRVSGPAGVDAQIVKAREQVASAAQALLNRAVAATAGHEEWSRILNELETKRWQQTMDTPPRSTPAAALHTPAAVAPLESPSPAYPALAREARIQGVVRFRVYVRADGHVADAELLGGHPLLVPAAMEAVRKYVYHATGAEFQTPADVNFVLPR